MTQVVHPTEIQDRVRKRYIDRLSVRLKKLRKDYVERNWPSLKAECRQVRQSAENFGFPELKSLAEAAENAIPEGEISCARMLPEAKEAAGNLIAAIEAVLATGSSYSLRN